MQHQISVEKYGPAGETMSAQIKACVHCGFCLASCPTYQVLEEEMDSPRGRIYLMKEALEHNISFDETTPYLDRCLGCMACVPACPSGVQYGELLISFRDQLQQNRRQTFHQKIVRFMVRHVLPFPGRFRLALRLGRLARPFRFLLPRQQSQMLDLLPSQGRSQPAQPDAVLHSSDPRARVALLTGCVQDVLAPRINRATLRVLAHNEIEVVPVPAQTCCGALAMHCGEIDSAQRLAIGNLDCFPADVDAILTNAAGCGSGMKEYPLLFAGTDRQSDAVAFANRVQDISVFLHRAGLKEPPPLPAPARVAYHDACHLSNAQGITAAPRELLRGIGNLEFVEIAHPACCGSAGTYNLEQPELAARFGEDKARAIVASRCDVVATGNIGCLIQIESSLRKLGVDIPVMHTIEVLDHAYSNQPLVS